MVFMAREVEGAPLRQVQDRPFDTPPSAATQGEVNTATKQGEGSEPLPKYERNAA